MQAGANPGISVYPNPAVNTMHISVHDNSQDSKLAVLDIRGRIVADFSGQRLDKTVAWNTSGLRAGLYFIRLTAGGRYYVERAFLVK